MFLLDTNVVSEMRRPVPDVAVRTWIESKPRLDQFLSVISLLEITRGANSHRDYVQRHNIQHWIDHTLRIWFEMRILPVPVRVAEDAGILMGMRERSGAHLTLADALIASTAIHRSAVLVTRNTKDFLGLPLELYNPWTDTFTLGAKQQ